MGCNRCTPTNPTLPYKGQLHSVNLTTSITRGLTQLSLSQPDTIHYYDMCVHHTSPTAVTRGSHYRKYLQRGGTLLWCVCVCVCVCVCACVDTPLHPSHRLSHLTASSPVGQTTHSTSHTASYAQNTTLQQRTF